MNESPMEGLPTEKKAQYSLENPTILKESERRTYKGD